MKSLRRSVLIIACVAAIVGTWFLSNTLLLHWVPQLFPLNDREATYTVVQTILPGMSTTRPQAVGWGDYYRLAYQGKKMVKRMDEGTGYVAVQIANSPVDLAPYLGRMVKVMGRFVYADQQCIQTQCLTLGRKPMIGVAIERIEATK